MKHGHRNIGMAIIAIIAFWIGAIVYVCKLIEEGARSTTVIPAICFPVAAVLLTISVMNLRKQTKTNQR